MNIEIDSEEFVKRKVAKEGEWSRDLEEALEDYYTDVVDVNCVLLDRSGWNKVQGIVSMLSKQVNKITFGDETTKGTPLQLWFEDLNDSVMELQRLVGGEKQ